jgi:integrase
MDIHHSDERLNAGLAKLHKDPVITEHNKHLISEFIDQLHVEDLSYSRILKYLYILKSVSKLIEKNFDEIIKEDVNKFYKNVKNMKVTRKTNGTTIKVPAEEWTKHDYKVLTRRFYRWIQEEKNIQNNETKCAINKIVSTEIKTAKSREKKPEHLLTPEEIKKMAEKTLYSRDRAFILTLYESCCRIGEILPVKMKDVKFDEYGCIIHVDGKTGYRPIRISAASPEISNWLTNHPDRNNPDAFLFCGIGRKNRLNMLTYQAARKIVFDAAERAGIKKRVNLHKFRASRATHLVTKQVSEEVLCKFGGWEIGSTVLREYVKLSNEQVDREILRAGGLHKTEKDSGGFEVIICKRCNQKNSPSSEDGSKAKFCRTCGLPLDEKTQITFDKERSELMKTLDDPKMFQIIVEGLQQQMNTLQKEIAELQKQKNEMK